MNEVNAYGNTPLHLACYNGQDVVVSELIKAGANINQVCICLPLRDGTFMITFAFNCVTFYLASGE